MSPKSILRAAVADLRAGHVVQGGSTITQQLVKNFYLNNRQTLARKAKEALMAILLDAHYSKPEILQAYLNEVYLGQDGGRAIHGFGLASYFYFQNRWRNCSRRRSRCWWPWSRAPATMIRVVIPSAP